MKPPLLKQVSLGLLLAVVVAACAPATPAAIPTPQVIQQTVVVTQQVQVTKEVPVTQQVEVTKEVQVTEPAAQNPLKTDTPVNISVRAYSWMVTGNNGLVGPQLRAWAAQYPNVKLDLQVVDDWTGVLAQDIAAGTAPDIVYYGDPTAYIKQGKVMDLSPYYDVSALQKDVLPDYWNYMYQDGKLYSIYQDTEMRVVYYRKDLAQKAGLTLPQNGWTYADMRDFAKKLTTAEMPGVCIGKEPWPWVAMSVADGVQYGQDYTYDSGAVKGLWQFLSDMIKDGSTPKAQAGLTRDQCYEQFAAGKAGMIFLNSNLISSLLRGDTNGALKADQIGVVSLPVAKGGEQFRSWGGGWMWWIINNKYDDLKKAYLVDLLKYVTSQTSQVEYALRWGFVLPRISYMNEVKRLVNVDASVKADPVAQFWPAWLDIAKVDFTNDPAKPNELFWALGVDQGVEAIQAGKSVDEAQKAAQTYFDANKK